MANKSVLNRAFSTREKIFVLILAVLAVIAVYYYAVVQNVSNIVKANEEQTAQVEDEIDAQQAVAMQRANIKATLDKLGDTSNLPYIASYDNVRAEFNEIDALVGSADRFNVSFQSPTISGTAIRRNVSISFMATDLSQAYDVVTSLTQGANFCRVNSFSIVDSNTNSSSSDWSCSLSVTFYETAVGATTTSGLVESKS